MLMYSIGQISGKTIWQIFWTGVSKERKDYWTHLIFLTDIHSSWNPDEIDWLHSFWSSILFHLLGFWDPGTVSQYCALGDTHDWTRTSHTLPYLMVLCKKRNSYIRAPENRRKLSGLAIQSMSIWVLGWINGVHLEVLVWLMPPSWPNANVLADFQPVDTRGWITTTNINPIIQDSHLPASLVFTRVSGLWPTAKFMCISKIYVHAMPSQPHPLQMTADFMQGSDWFVLEYCIKASLLQHPATAPVSEQIRDIHHPCLRIQVLSLRPTYPLHIQHTV